MTLRNVIAAMGFAAGLLISVGCGSSGGTPTVPVTGTVTYKGAPLTNVNVVFTPTSGRPATGATDSSGRFTLSTFAANDGAVPGKHTVAITQAPGDTPPPMPGMPGAGAQKLPFPARYSDSSKSGLSADVVEGETNDFAFELTD